MSHFPSDHPPDSAGVTSHLSLHDEARLWAQRGDQLQKAGNFKAAIAAYDLGLARLPDDFVCLCHKAMALEQLNFKDEALALAQDALRIDPHDREALMLCGRLERHLGNRVAAHACFLTVARMGVVRNYPTKQRPAKFRALLLFSPEAGNTPYESLIKGGDFDSEVLLIVQGYRNDPGDRSPRVDVVINLLSDADFGLDMIATAIDLADTLDRPVVNHPRLMLGTDRESISKRLAFVPDAVMPETVRIEARDLRARARNGDLPSLPLIVRRAAMHGGEKMELARDRDELLRVADAIGDGPLYMTEFVDYQSPDGLFRKYRFVFVGDRILPYHLAIGDGWKVHHATTRMGELAWMQAEEQAFLDDPARVFGARGMAALELIRRQIGLDYFGIDCALDAEGRVLVFEANASMLIHLDNPGFEYKVPYVRRIVEAFHALLAEKAGENRSRIEVGLSHMEASPLPNPPHRGEGLTQPPR